MDLHAVPEFITPHSIIAATVSNDTPGDVVVQAVISSDEGEVLLQVTSQPFRLDGGISVLSGTSIDLHSIEYASHPTAHQLKASNALPFGNYQHCLTIEGATGGEFGVAEQCVELSATDPSFMELVYPMHMDTIDQTRPTLQWFTDRLAGSPNTRFQLVLVEHRSGVGHEASIISDEPILLLPDVTTLSVIYPMDIGPLTPGKSYVWQVQQIERRSNAMVGTTETWAFYIRKESRPTSLKYAVLGQRMVGGHYTVHDGKVFFRYDEPYSSDRMRCEIYDSKQRPIQVNEAERQGKEGQSLEAIQQGANQYELDIQPLRLKPGFYILSVLNEKNEPRYLRIRIER